jgi:hypothetical protein
MEDQLITARIRALMVASYTMAAVILVITAAMVVGLFVSNELVDNEKVFGLLGYVMTSVVSAVAGSYATLMGMKGDVQPQEILELKPTSSVEAPVTVSVVNDLDDDLAETTPVVSHETTSMIDEPIDRTIPAGTIFPDDDDDDMAPWEKYRNDLRYDLNGDGVITEEDFPDWRNPAR